MERAGLDHARAKRKRERPGGVVRAARLVRRELFFFVCVVEAMA
jgi:hypothetical protein